MGQFLSPDLMEQGVKVNSYRAFRDAIKLAKGNVSLVSHLGTANSVWICKKDSEELFVIKYFTEDDHGRLHYKAEKELISGNQALEFIPEFIGCDEDRNWIATRFIKSHQATPIQLKDVLNVIADGFDNLELSFQAHDFPPGILNSNLHTYENSPLQTVIEAELRNLLWFPEFMQEVKLNWKRNSIVHGDMKLSNLVMRENQITVFDWENVSLGPCEWDIAGILQSVVAESLGSQEIKLWSMRNLKYCIEQIVDLDDFSRKCFALKCVQSAFEYSSTVSLMPRLAVNMLQIAEYAANKNEEKLRKIADYAS